MDTSIQNTSLDALFATLPVEERKQWESLVPAMTESEREELYQILHTQQSIAETFTQIQNKTGISSGVPPQLITEEEIVSWTLADFGNARNITRFQFTVARYLEENEPGRVQEFVAALANALTSTGYNLSDKEEIAKLYRQGLLLLQWIA